MSLRDAIAQTIVDNIEQGATATAVAMVALLREKGIPLMVESYFGRATAWDGRLVAVDLGPAIGEQT